MSGATTRGFTLVEVLVAMALLSLLMLGLLTAMRSFAQSGARIDERIRIDDDLRVSERFLRTVVATVSPRIRPASAGAPREIDFYGRGDELRWIGVMPARHGAGGLYRFRLFAQPAGEGVSALALEFFPYVPGFEAPLDPASVQSRVLAAGAGTVRFRYQDDLARGEQWLEDWPHKDRLPRRIDIALPTGHLSWPATVVAVTPVTGPLGIGRGGGLVSGPIIGPY
jgi:general secretion pathway protein J